MPQVEGEIVIRRPVDELFDFVADERNEPRYNPRMRDVELVTDEPVGKGSTFCARLKTGGRTMPTTMELTEFDRPRRLASSTHSSMMDTVGTLIFEPVGDAARMRWSWEVQPRGALHLISPVVGLIGRRREQDIWANLKRLLETGRSEASVVVLVVGIPGAGKTVLIDRAARAAEWTVLDLDRFRRRLPTALRRMPVPYPLYVLALVWAIARYPHVVAESRGTYAWLRRLVTACARIRGREAVIVLLDASSADARAGQLSRGRVAPELVMQANTSRWGRLLDAARSGALADEGWSRVLVLDRAQASKVADLGDLVGEPAATGRDNNERGEADDQSIVATTSSDLQPADEEPSPA